MKWSFRIATVSGIEVRVHATFLILLAFYGFASYRHAGPVAALAGVIAAALPARRAAKLDVLAAISTE